MSKLTEYPEELTDEQFDDIAWDSDKTFGYGDDRPNHDIAVEVEKYAAECNGQIYTHIDSDSGDIIRSRGNHFVNRIGLWDVVTIKGVEPHNA